jgi:hypothetical protein
MGTNVRVRLLNDGLLEKSVYILKVLLPTNQGFP